MIHINSSPRCLETLETFQFQAALAWLVQALHMEWSKACKEDNNAVIKSATSEALPHQK